METLANTVQGYQMNCDVMQVLATFPAEGKSLNDLDAELRTIASNYEKMQEKYSPVNLMT